MLPTMSSELDLRSPIALERARASGGLPPAGLALADLTGRRVFHIRQKPGNFPRGESPGSRVPSLLRADKTDGWIWARLTEEEHLLLARAPDAQPLESMLGEPGALGRTITDLTHGLAAILVSGREAPSLLRQACALDLNEDAFPDRSAAQASLAKIRATILRWDWGAQRAYLCLVDRSVGRYLWEILVEMGQAFQAHILDGGAFPDGTENTN